MSLLFSCLENKKYNYKKIFSENLNYFLEEVVRLYPKGFIEDIYGKCENNSRKKELQNKIIKFLENNFEKMAREKFDYIKSEYKKYSCLKCGKCCRFAVSEYSPLELKKKSANGDKTALEFINTFVLYENESQYEKIFPQYIEMLKYHNIKNYYIYHCNKVQEDNTCSDYASRPKICKDFPDNPIAFLHIGCGYMEWKNNCENILLDIMAKFEISEFYKRKIKG